MVTQVYIPIMLDYHSILQLESYVINILKLNGEDIKIPKKHYYLEAVGLYLWQYDNDKLLSYLLPLVDRILRSHTKYLDDMPYEDAFQQLSLFLLQRLPNFDPSKGKLYSYCTMHLKFHAKTITSANFKRVCKTSSLTNLEVSHSDNGSEILYEFLDYLKSYKDIPSHPEDYKAIYNALYSLLFTEGSLHALANYPLTTLSKKTKIKDQSYISQALCDLKSEYGDFKFRSNTHIYRIDTDEGE